jgi:CBS domain containing-hemolysin-like protein
MLIASSAAEGWSTAVGVLSIPVLIALNALFVAAQFALVALRRTRVEEMTKQGVPGARPVAQAMDDLDRCVAATQLGTVLIGLLLGWLAEPAVADLLQPLVDRLDAAWHEFAFRSVSTVLTFLLITFLSVVFGELIPKTVGLQSCERTALLLARPLLGFTWLAQPLIRLMDGAGNAILRMVGYPVEAEVERPHSAQELMLLIEDSAEAGALTPNQAAFVRNLLLLSEKKAADVLVPINKVGAIEYGAPPDVLLERIRQGTFTRMPVYSDSLDNILGVANTKQLLRQCGTTGMVALEEAIYPAVFVAPTDPLPQVMKVLREARFPMALVRDLDGKVLGLLTLEDVIEEVVGDIVDEHDYPAPKLTPRMLQALLKSLPKRKPAAGLQPAGAGPAQAASS